MSLETFDNIVNKEIIHMILDIQIFNRYHLSRQRPMVSTLSDMQQQSSGIYYQLVFENVPTSVISRHLLGTGIGQYV